MKQLSRGFLIAFEGIDGSGKTFLIHNLYITLQKHELPVILTKEPGDTLLGKEIRSLVQTQRINIYSKAEYLLFAADRAQHFNEVIIPNLKAKKLILSDRLGDSSIVYQGYGRGLDIGMIKTINQWAMSGFKSNLTFYIAIDAQTAINRFVNRGKKLTAFEQEPIEFFQQLIDGYEQLYQNEQNVVILDGNQSPDELTKQAYDQIIKLVE